MAVPAHEWKRVLTAECSNPNVIRRNGLSKMPKFRVDIRIVVCSSLRHLKHGAIANETVQPARIAHPMAGLGNSVTIFSKHNHGEKQLIRSAQGTEDRGISFRGRRDCIGI